MLLNLNSGNKEIRMNLIDVLLKTFTALLVVYTIVFFWSGAVAEGMKCLGLVVFSLIVIAIDKLRKRGAVR